MTAAELHEILDDENRKDLLEHLKGADDDNSVDPKI